MKLAALLSLVLAGGALAPAVPAPASHLPLPLAGADMTFEPGTTEITLDELLQRLAHLTGLELAMTAQTQQMLRSIKEPLEFAEPVPKDEVYSFVEAFLAHQGLVIAPITGGRRPILGVSASPAGGRDAPLDALYVDEADLAELELHPALLVRLLVQLKNIDTRQVQTQLRQLLVDNTGTSQIVPVGEHSLILQGRARDIAGLTQLLHEADKASAARPPAPANPEGPAK
ncbi:MAG: hypothetical protein EXS08_07050 [Planctomycetes bacterium]|nr:hypothetical protein [Planctomycetota bacterium]